MAKLFNKTKNHLIINNMTVANNFFKRLKGYMFSSPIGEQDGLLIPHCNSIHTFFMNFNLDVIFLDKKDTVKYIRKNVTPHKILLPVLSSSKVVELSAGTIDKYKIDIGDTLYVED